MQQLMNILKICSIKTRYQKNVVLRGVMFEFTFIPYRKYNVLIINNYPFHNFIPQHQQAPFTLMTKTIFEHERNIESKQKCFDSASATCLQCPTDCQKLDIIWY